MEVRSTTQITAVYLSCQVGNKMSTKYFNENCRYLVLNDFVSGLNSFVQGEILTYISGGYSRYDDCFIYEFMDNNGCRKEFILEKEYDDKNLNLFSLLS